MIDVDCGLEQFAEWTTIQEVQLSCKYLPGNPQEGQLLKEGQLADTYE